jgi:hypothetical protein
VEDPVQAQPGIHRVEDVGDRNATIEIDAG